MFRPTTLINNAYLTGVFICAGLALLCAPALVPLGLAIATG